MEASIKTSNSGRSNMSDRFKAALLKKLQAMPDIRDVLEMVRSKQFLYMKNVDKEPIIPAALLKTKLNLPKADARE